MTNPRTHSYALSDVGKLFQEAMEIARDAVESKNGTEVEAEAKKWLVAEREAAVKEVQREFGKIHQMRGGVITKDTANYLSENPRISFFTSKIPPSLLNFERAFVYGLTELFDMFGFRDIRVCFSHGAVFIMLSLHPCSRKIVTYLDIHDKYTIFVEKTKRGEAVDSESLELLDLMAKASSPVSSAEKERETNGAGTKSQEKEGAKPGVKVEEQETEEKDVSVGDAHEEGKETDENLKEEESAAAVTEDGSTTEEEDEESYVKVASEEGKDSTE